MSPIAAVSPIDQFSGRTNSGGRPDELRAAFQDAVGSLFYGQMIKALRSGVGKPAYLHGGQAEEMFQLQMDQQVAASLARDHASGFVEDLYQRFLIDHRPGGASNAAQISALRQSAKSTEIAESADRASWARPAVPGAGITIGTGVIPVMNRK
jgi:Rod binding domain-containing protein